MITVTNENGTVRINVNDAEGLTSEQLRNLSRLETWANDYNSDASRFVLANYVEDCDIHVPGILKMRGHQTFEALEMLVQKQTPQRFLVIERVLPSGGSITVHANVVVPRDGQDDFVSPCIATLDFRDGLVERDTTFLDAQAWLHVGLFPAIDPAAAADYDLEITDTIGRFEPAGG